MLRCSEFEPRVGQIPPVWLQSLNPLNTACPRSHLFWEVAILGLYLAPSTCSLSICVPHIHKDGFIAIKRHLTQSDIQYLVWQLNFSSVYKTFMEHFMRINALNPHYTHSPCHLLLSLTLSHKELGEDAIRQGDNERSLRRDGGRQHKILLVRYCSQTL